MWTRVMIVLGADTHKRSHTLAAINVATGQVLGDKTVQVGPRGFATLLGWARELDGQRVWALEDCRHVSAALERFLLGRGERVGAAEAVARARYALATASDEEQQRGARQPRSWCAPHTARYALSNRSRCAAGAPAQPECSTSAARGATEALSRFALGD